MDRLTDVKYVHDALKERLPAGWSLSRGEDRGDSAIYTWTDWRTGSSLTCEVLEGYAYANRDVDQLCDNLMRDVTEWFELNSHHTLVGQH